MEHALVTSPRLFASSKFDPSSMEFSGVSVEAEDIKQACEVYMRPKEHDQVFWCEEPTATVIKRRIHNSRMQIADSQAKMKEHLEEAQKSLSLFAAQVLAVKIASELAELNKNISLLAENVRATSNDYPDLTTEKLYDKLIERYVQQLQRLGFRRGDGDFSK